MQMPLRTTERPTSTPPASVRDPNDPALPARGPKLRGSTRQRFGAAFNTGADTYRSVRPSYPDDAVDFLLQGHGPERGSIVEFGAGSGQLTQKLLPRGYRVEATEPAAGMLDTLREQLQQYPRLGTHRVSAEDTALPAGQATAVLAAQAWHWFEPGKATHEAARLSQPGARLGLIWNQLDVTHPWVHRLSRIMHAGDVHGIEWRPPIAPGYYNAPEMYHTYWRQHISIDGIVALAQTRTYWLNANEQTRRRVEENIRWYLGTELGFDEGAVIELPYRCSALRANLLG